MSAEFADLLYRPGFQVSGMVFPHFNKNPGDRHLAAFLDDVISVDEFHAKHVGEPHANRSSAGPHEPDQHYVDNIPCRRYSLLSDLRMFFKIPVPDVNPGRLGKGLDVLARVVAEIDFNRLGITFTQQNKNGLDGAPVNVIFHFRPNYPSLSERGFASINKAGGRRKFTQKTSLGPPSD